MIVNYANRIMIMLLFLQKNENKYKAYKKK
ncbi:hypothetical protein OKW21_006207 [Catalinimonas alkaloidigena]|nr:hypothetical protein [Catalinimonas alkaloidigena]